MTSVSLPYQKISRNAARDRTITCRPLSTSSGIVFPHMCTLELSLLHFISLNARFTVPPVSFARVDFRGRRRIDTSGVSISRTWAQLRKTSARTPGRETFFIFRPGVRSSGLGGSFSLKYRGNQSPARVAAIAVLFSALFPALGSEVMG